MRIPVTKRWRFPGAASFTLQPLLPRWLLSFRSLRRSSRFFFPFILFFSFQFFHPVPLLRPFQINHFVTFFHSIPFLHPVHLPVCFVAVGLLRWLPHFWRATIWTIICSLSGPLRPLAATHGHLQPAAATSDRNRAANASVPNLAPSRPGPPKKKTARFATWLGWSLFFPFWRFIVFEQAETEEHRFSCHGVSNKFPQTKAFNLWVWRRMFLTMSTTIFLFTLIPARCLQGIKTDQNRKIKKRKRIQNESGKRKNQSENVERINMQWEL